MIDIEKYVYLVKKVAAKLKQSLPPQVDIGDLEGAGYLGLLDAANRFDPKRGVKFETFSMPRIRGAILDELRKLDWVPRLVRQKGEEPIYMANFSDITAVNNEADDTTNRSDFILAVEDDDVIDRMDREERISAAIDRLKPKYRMAVILYYYEGLTLKEAAYYMGATESRICQILRRARPILGKYLKKHS